MTNDIMSQVSKYYHRQLQNYIFDPESGLLKQLAEQAKDDSQSQQRFTKFVLQNMDPYTQNEESTTFQDCCNNALKKSFTEDERQNYIKLFEHIKHECHQLPQPIEDNLNQLQDCLSKNDQQLFPQRVENLKQLMQKYYPQNLKYQPNKN